MQPFNLVQIGKREDLEVHGAHPQHLDILRDLRVAGL
jgi:hypothetical protein